MAQTATATVDYYDTLDVDRGAAPEEIKRAYRKAARENHPDLHPNDPEATRKTQEINKAYEVLSDETLRKQYDQRTWQQTTARNATASGEGYKEAASNPQEQAWSNQQKASSKNKTKESPKPDTKDNPPTENRTSAKVWEFSRKTIFRITEKILTGQYDIAQHSGKIYTIPDRVLTTLVILKQPANQNRITDFMIAAHNCVSAIDSTNKRGNATLEDESNVRYTVQQVGKRQPDWSDPKYVEQAFAAARLHDLQNPKSPSHVESLAKVLPLSATTAREALKYCNPESIAQFVSAFRDRLPDSSLERRIDPGFARDTYEALVERGLQEGDGGARVQAFLDTLKPVEMNALGMANIIQQGRAA